MVEEGQQMERTDVELAETGRVETREPGKPQVVKAEAIGA
jgi:hypothetical protein